MIDNVNKKTLPNWLFVFLMLTLTVTYNVDFRSVIIPMVNHSLMQGCTYLLSALMLADIIMKNKFQKINVFLLWSICFLLFFLFSSLWAIDVELTQFTVFNILSGFLLLSVLSYYVEDKEAFEKVLIANYVAIVLCAVYLLTVVDLSALDTRLGASVEGMESWNANDIGMKMSCGAMLSYYFASKSKKIYWKLLYICLTVGFISVSLFSGSRKAFLMIILMLFGYSWIKSKGYKKIGTLIVSGIGLYILFKIIMNIPTLYDIIGVRMETLFDGYFGSGTQEGSFRDRQFFIDFGMKNFWEKPILGYGLAGFSALLRQHTGVDTYSHNNFVEILVSGGIIGFCIYYFIYAYLIKKLWKPAFKYKDEQAIALLIINVVYLILHWGLVAYNDMLNNIFILAIMVNYNKIDSPVSNIRSRFKKNGKSRVK